MDSMISDQKLANAFGGKSARACDNCVKKRARWYCAADDAFLCQSCDSSVHSANPLASRHERVRLKTASFKTLDKTEPGSLSTWHKGFTRKARTPRQKKPEKIINPIYFVPEFCSEENSQEDNEEELLYRVPIFDPIGSDQFSQEMNSLGFLPTEMDLAEFAADVESLLGKGLEDHESFDMEGLGLLDQNDQNDKVLDERVKVENNDHVELIDMGRETFEINFDYNSPITCEEQEEEDNKGPIVMNINDSKKIFLRLDYEGVRAAWDDCKSPWMTGERPELDSDDCLLDCMGPYGTMHVHGDMGMMSGHAAAMADGGREARVSRYREKRRTRLFSKKIRYEVRKLNAEKRPRMKGRFVKRSNFVSQPAAAFTLMLNK